MLPPLNMSNPSTPIAARAPLVCPGAPAKTHEPTFPINVKRRRIGSGESVSSLPDISLDFSSPPSTPPPSSPRAKPPCIKTERDAAILAALQEICPFRQRAFAGLRDPRTIDPRKGYY